MKLAILIACLATSAIAQDAVGTRIAQSAAAAERLQGLLDGSWTLRDARGRALFVLQIDDPVSGGPLSCAWRRPGGAMGVATCRESGGRLTIDLESAGRRRVSLYRTHGGVWRGQLLAGGVARAVILQRG